MNETHTHSDGCGCTIHVGVATSMMETPSIPSTTAHCYLCDTEVWVSIAMTARIQARYPDVNIDYVCVLCYFEKSGQSPAQMAKSLAASIAMAQEVGDL